MFYAVGSFLFAFAFLAALAVIAGNLFAYWDKMIAALRTLSLDRVGPAAPVIKTRLPVHQGRVRQSRRPAAAL